MNDADFRTYNFSCRRAVGFKLRSGRSPVGERDGARRIELFLQRRLQFFVLAFFLLPLLRFLFFRLRFHFSEFLLCVRRRRILFLKFGGLILHFFCLLQHRFEIRIVQWIVLCVQQRGDNEEGN